MIGVEKDGIGCLPVREASGFWILVFSCSPCRLRRTRRFQEPRHTHQDQVRRVGRSLLQDQIHIRTFRRACIRLKRSRRDLSPLVVICQHTTLHHRPCSLSPTISGTLFGQSHLRKERPSTLAIFPALANTFPSVPHHCLLNPLHIVGQCPTRHQRSFPLILASPPVACLRQRT